MPFSSIYIDHLNKTITSPKITGQSFRTLRKALGKTVRDLAPILGVDKGTISHWERGNDPVNRIAWRLMILLVKERMTSRNEMLNMLEGMRK